MKRFSIQASFLMALAALVAPTIAHAFPNKPVQFVVTYPPGAANDILARTLAPYLSKKWGQQVIVDNRPGANGIVGTDLVAKANPDGHTLVLGTDGPLAINSALYPSLPYDPVADFAPITQLARYQLVLISTEATSVSDLVSRAKRQPGKINYASVGIGSQHHLAMELFKSMAGVDIVHVPYKGAAPALVGMLGGEVSVMFNGTAAVREFVRDGKVKPLAVSAGTRSPVMPEVATIGESGYPKFNIAVWFGVLAPAKTPPEIVQQIHDAYVEVLKIAEVRDALLGQGLEPTVSQPAEFAAFIRAERDKWASIVKLSGATLSN
jgi:tripartite-type tricarboxylate transporter receptor subunit TctC